MHAGCRGSRPKLAKGEIASLSGAGDDPRYFQISVPVQPGNSGGALVDERGNVVGVVSAKLSTPAALASSGSLPENVNYAVKSSFLLGLLESVPRSVREAQGAGDEGAEVRGRGEIRRAGGGAGAGLLILQPRNTRTTRKGDTKTGRSFFRAPFRVFRVFRG